MPGWHISSGGGGAAAGGDVSGPGASTDNALVRWNGTAGTDIQNGVLRSADLNGDLTGPTSANDTSAVGSAFTNQPANDSVSLVSDDAGDTQNATIIGTTNGAGDTVTTEVVALTGLTPVESSTSDWEIILAITLDSPATGTITASETSGGLTITTIAALASSAGLDTTALTAWNRTISIVSDGATTKQIGIVGTDSGGSVAYDSQALTGTTAVTSNDAFATITGFLIGDLEGTRTVTFTTTGGTKIDGQFVMGAPSSSTDNAVARFDGATGKLLQNSAVTVADTTGDIVTPGFIQVRERTFAGSGGSGIFFGGTSSTQAALRGGYAVSGVPLVYPFKADDSGEANIGTSGALLSGSVILITQNFNDTSSYYIRLSSAGVATASGGEFYWYDSSPGPGGGADAGLRRAAAGVVATSTFGSSTIGGFLTGRVVEANTAGSGTPNALTATESWKVLTNEGATAANYHTLPTAAAGYIFTFCCQDADGIRITANTGDTIRVIDKVTAAAGYIESTTIGSTVTLVAINATEWFAISINGVWTDGTFTYDDTSLTSP